MKIGVVQFKPELFQAKENVRKALEISKNFDGDLLIFPELAFTGYLFNSSDELEKVSEYNAVTIEKWQEFSSERDCAVIFGYPEKFMKKFYNSSVMILPNGALKVYRKTHLFSEEKRLFQSGDTGFFVENFKGVNIGLAICFDWFFPESFRTLALLGADIIAHLANLVMPYCQGANIYSSIQNRVYIATANRWGRDKNDEKELRFTGESQITSPSGEIIAKAPKTGNVIIEADIDPMLSRDKRLNAFNDVLKDRKPNFYKLEQ